jgi:hypothetical protein
MAKVAVLISFDYDNDLVGHAKDPDSRFEIDDHSVKDNSPNWKDGGRLKDRGTEPAALDRSSA